MASLSLKNVCKVYPNGFEAVKNFNLEIADKEFIIFVGPSGCGKSTTLRMIAGLEDISSGELRIGDRVVNDVEPKDRDIAMVFQNYALYPHMTVYENIAFGLRLRKLPKDEIHRRVVEAADILGITEYLDKKPKEMSGGQRQRVALGRAIVREPKVMLLDEPLSNLDAKLRTQMRAEISKLHTKLQTTFIYVTHDQVEAMTMGTRIVVMKDGYVQQIDTPKNLYNYPENKFVASFIGTPQMNFFEGTLLKTGDEVIMKFDYSDVDITVPYSMLYKAKPGYLDGKTKVCIGLRAEDINVVSDKVKNERAIIKAVVSHKEELGNETLIYGDINLNSDGYSESSTRIILKDNSEREIKAGDIIDVALNLDRVHLFDAETERSVLPRIPEFNYLDCEIKDGKLKFSGAELDLPEAVRCGNGTYELLIPTDAVTFGGNLKATVVSRENINGVNLVALTLGGKRLYAVNADCSDSDGGKILSANDGYAGGDTVNVGVDFKKITVLAGGENVVSPMPDKNGIDCRFVKRKIAVTEEVNGKTRRRKEVRFGFEIGGVFFEVSDAVSQKMFAALGIKKAFASPLKLEFGLYGIGVSENGITATVEEVLDFGAEKFVKCKVGENSVYFNTDEEYAGEIRILPDFENVGVVETERDIKII